MEKRMYFLVHRSLSSMQKGIQAGHAALEYCLQNRVDTEMWNFIKNDKTWIVLEGGVNVDLSLHESYLKDVCKIKISKFNEPDLNDCPTALCFIVDERVYDREKYPSFPDFVTSIYPDATDMRIYTAYKIHPEEVINSYSKEYKVWVENMGGESNVLLREYLSQFKKAI